MLVLGQLDIIVSIERGWYGAQVIILKAVVTGANLRCASRPLLLLWHCFVG
jgi:hypothetical protein